MKISITRLKTFKACRRAYQLRYIEKLVPVKPADALETGTRYHDYVEKINKGEPLEEEDFSKECAMALAYQKYIFPFLPEIRTAEEWKEYDLGQGDTLIGRVDAFTLDNALVEHKTTSGDITEEYEYTLQWDEQILAYMLISGARTVYYTVIKKPTIRRGKNESEEEFFERMKQWYEVDTSSKIRLLILTRSDEDIEAFRQELINTLEEVKNPKCLYRNTLHCFRWGRQCEYAQICLNYDPSQEYVNYRKEE